jgi:flavin-dependent dehydrogenase
VLRLQRRQSIILAAMDSEYDVVIMGGAFAGSATAMLLKRKQPKARVLIVEKTAEFDRKVGESTTELASCYLTRILGLGHYLGHNQLSKQGLRMWFSNRPDQQFDDCVELGAHYQTRLQTFQVDRAKLDQHMLDLAVEAGCDLLRPAKIVNCELGGKAGQNVTVNVDGQQRNFRARWLIDASGRAAVLSRKLGYFRPNTEHPINAVWARFTGVKDWDSYDWRQRFPKYANACRTSRNWATNHLMGDGWWVWIIALRGGDVSVGIVYDSRLFKLPEGPTLSERLYNHLLGNAIGREIFAKAKVIEGDVHAFSNLSYFSERTAGDGWALVGDATGFIDPLYSPGLDFCAYTSYYVSDILARSVGGEDVMERVHYYDRQFPIAYRYWFETLYKNKYYYMGDADLMSAALLLDVGTYFIGLVIPIYRDPEGEFFNLPFEGLPGRVFGAMMKFYNRRLFALANRRHAVGYFGSHNHGWRELYDGFVPDVRVRHLIRKGLFRWWKCELINLWLIITRGRRQTVSARGAADSSRPVGTNETRIGAAAESSV